jgi:hypothetical protein
MAEGADYLKNWEVVEGIIKSEIGLLRERFPSQLFLPTIGNNDVMYHNQMPANQTYSDIYYGGLFDSWFGDSVDAKYQFDKEAVRETFMKGGYYSHDFANTAVTFVGLNTMYMNGKN